MPYLFSVPIAQLRANSLLIYYERQYDNKYAYKPMKHMLKNFHKEKAYSGSITAHTKKRIKRAVTILTQSAQNQRISNPITNKEENFKLNFITLTIPLKQRMINCREGYKLLMAPFLDWLRKTHNVKTYVWKAEFQKRGQLHYHIVTTTWIHYQAIRNKWNYLLGKADMMKEYYAQHGNCNPNSTDIHKVFHIKNVAAYISKYMSKENDEQPDNKGKIWDCSTNLKGVKYFSVPLLEVHERKIVELSTKRKIRCKETQHCTMMFTDVDIGRYILTKPELNDFADYLQRVRTGNTSLLN